MSKSVEQSEDVENNNSARARTTHADERRRSLVLAAYDLIAEKGFEDLRTRDVAARAGVNIATLHYYFASKEDLRSEEHTSELQSQSNLVCRLLLEKKKQQ